MISKTVLVCFEYFLVELRIIIGFINLRNLLLQFNNHFFPNLLQKPLLSVRHKSTTTISSEKSSKIIKLITTTDNEEPYSFKRDWM